MDVITWATIASALNIFLLLSLLVIYIRNYIRIKSKFCLGLIAFATLFLIHNSVAMYFEMNYIQHYTARIAEISLILNVLAALGFSALLYITWEPV